MENLIAIVTDENRILIGFEKPENLADAKKIARKNAAHCYLLRDGFFEIIKDKIGQQVEFGYYWKFEHEEMEMPLVERRQFLLWPDLYEQNN